MHLRITIFFIILCLSIPAFSQSYEQCIEQAYQAAQHDSLTQAEALYRQALKLSPGDHRNALVHHDLGHVQEMIYWNDITNTKIAEEAMYNYTRAIELLPMSVPVRLSRANFHLNLKNYEKAAEDYTAAVKKDPTNTEALNHRAFAYYQNRNYDKAMQDYKNILERHPSDYNAALGVALVLQKTHKVSEAVRRMEFLIIEHPDKAELYAVRSSMFTDLNYLDLAIVDINQAIKLQPKNPAYLLQRADIYEKQGKLQKAKQDKEKARQL